MENSPENSRWSYGAKLAGDEINDDAQDQIQINEDEVLDFPAPTPSTPPNYPVPPSPAAVPPSQIPPTPPAPPQFSAGEKYSAPRPAPPEHRKPSSTGDVAFSNDTSPNLENATELSEDVWKAPETSAQFASEVTGQPADEQFSGEQFVTDHNLPSFGQELADFGSQGQNPTNFAPDYAPEPSNTEPSYAEEFAESGPADWKDPDTFFENEYTPQNDANYGQEVFTNSDFEENTFDQNLGGDSYDEFDDEIDDDFEEDEEQDAAAAARRNMIEWGAVLVAAVLASLLIRAFLVQAFWIPTPSMESTLEIRDRVMVNKMSYRFSDISRGDIVVFQRTDEQLETARRSDPKAERDLIKRVIGLPGEVVERRDNAVYITRVGETEAERLDEPYLDPGTVNEPFPATTVPEGHIFVMGDNRRLSDDSTKSLGPVDADRVSGRAFVLFWPLDRAGGL